MSMDTNLVAKNCCPAQQNSIRIELNWANSQASTAQTRIWLCVCVFISVAFDRNFSFSSFLAESKTGMRTFQLARSLQQATLYMQRFPRIPINVLETCTCVNQKVSKKCTGQDTTPWKATHDVASCCFGKTIPLNRLHAAARASCERVLSKCR